MAPPLWSIAVNASEETSPFIKHCPSSDDALTNQFPYSYRQNLAMPLQRVELGRQSFASKKAKLQVEVSASADLTLSEFLGDFSYIHTPLPLAYQSVWISKAHNFQFSFSFSFDPHFQATPQQTTALLECISPVLESADLWRQLSFNASLHFSDDEQMWIPGGSKTALLILSDLLNDFPQQEGQEDIGIHHSSGDSLDNNNLRPPVTVPTLLLSSVNVHFNLCPTPLSEQESSLPVKPIAPKQGSNIITPNLASTLNTEQLLPLIDVAFRSVLCPKPIRASPGIKSADLDPFHYLADLAPKIFVPEYARLVADRIVLVPVISKFLTSFLASTDNAEGRLVWRELIRQTRPEQKELYENETKTDKKESNRITTVVKGHLWLTLTNGLRTVEPTRRLKPLTCVYDEDLVARSSGLRNDENVLDFPGFEDFLNTSNPFAPEYDQMLFEAEEDESCHSDDPFLFDLYDASLATRTRESLDTSVETDHNNAHVELRHSALSLPPAIREYDSDSSSGSEILLNSATSVPGAACEWGSTLSFLEQIILQEQSAEENLRMHTGLNDSTGLSGPAAHSPSFRKDTIGAIVMTEPTIRQHPAPPCCADNDDQGKTTSFCEDLDYHEHFSDHFSRRSTVSQQDEKAYSSQFDSLLLQEKPELEAAQMPSDTRRNRSSLSEILVGDHVLWRMWKRRPSVAPQDENVVEMHAMCFQNPDITVPSWVKTNEGPQDNDEMLETELSASSSLDFVRSSTFEGWDFSTTQPRPRAGFPISQPMLSSSMNQSKSKSMAKGVHGFTKFLSSSRSSSDRMSVDLEIQDLISSQSRDMEIKKRKTLEDYEMSSDGNEMLLG